MSIPDVDGKAEKKIPMFPGETTGEANGHTDVQPDFDLGEKVFRSSTLPSFTPKKYSMSRTPSEVGKMQSRSASFNQNTSYAELSNHFDEEILE